MQCVITHTPGPARKEHVSSRKVLSACAQGTTGVDVAGLWRVCVTLQASWRLRVGLHCLHWYELLPAHPLAGPLRLVPRVHYYRGLRPGHGAQGQRLQGHLSDGRESKP